MSSSTLVALLNLAAQNPSIRAKLRALGCAVVGDVFSS